METDATGEIKVITNKGDDLFYADGESVEWKKSSYESCFKMTYNPESDNTHFFLEVLGHIWMSLQGIWPNAPRLILKWEVNADEPNRYS